MNNYRYDCKKENKKNQRKKLAIVVLIILTIVFGIVMFLRSYNPSIGVNTDDSNNIAPITSNTEIKGVQYSNKPGYKFGGWYDNAEFLGEALTEINENVENVYFKWIPNENTIVFNGNDSTSGEMVELIISTDDTANLAINKFVKDGYTFSGWAEEKESEVVYTDGASYTMGTNESYILYAVWTPNHNLLHFDGNGATTGTMSEILCESNASVALLENVFAKEGYKFAGWSTLPTGEVRYLDGDVYKMGLADSYVLYAQWDKAVYSLSLVGDNGVQNGAGDYELNTKVTVTAIPSDGYEFVGWYDNEDFSGLLVSDESTFNYEITKSSKLYAKYNYIPVDNKLKVVVNNVVYGEKLVIKLYNNESEGSLKYLYKVQGANDSTYNEVEPKNVGKYNVKVSIEQTPYYNMSNIVVDFEITKANYNMTGVSFESITSVYDGTEKVVAVTGTLPSGVSVAYVNNGRTAYGTQDVFAYLT
ncbi:MAG: InlB B-repeat-containing protein, partial [Clostridia bacterium]